MKKIFTVVILILGLSTLSFGELGQALSLSNYATKLVIPNDYSTVCEPAVGQTTSLSSSYHLCTSGQGQGFGTAQYSTSYSRFSFSLSAPVPATQKWVEFSWYDATTSGVGGYCTVSAGATQCEGSTGGGSVTAGDQVAVVIQTQRVDSSTAGYITFERAEWMFQ